MITCQNGEMAVIKAANFGLVRDENVGKRAKFLHILRTDRDFGAGEHLGIGVFCGYG